MHGFNVSRFICNHVMKKKDRNSLMTQLMWSIQRLGSVSSESLPYFVGLPLVGGGTFSKNYSRGDVLVAEITVALLAAFAKGGDPTPRDHPHEVSWPRYELNTQQYLSIGEFINEWFHCRN